MKEFLNSESFILALTVLCYYIGVIVNRRWNIALTNPLLIAIILLITALHFLGIEYAQYEKGSHVISYLLSPTVVALGYSLYTQTSHIKGNLKPIFSAIICGALTGILSVWGICQIFNTAPEIVTSLEPKSVTMPIALAITERTGAIMPITAVSVFFCGIFGNIIGPFYLRMLKISNPLAVGIALGSASHGIGTARALQLGELQGAVSGMAISLMGIATALLMPLLQVLLR